MSGSASQDVQAPAGPGAEQAPVAGVEEEPTAAAGGTHKRGASRFGSALKWAYILNTGSWVITALLTFILAGILQPWQFGVLAIAMGYVALSLILLQHGPTIAVIQLDDIRDEHLNAAFWSTMAGAGVFTVVLVGVAPLLAALNHTPQLTAVLLALAPAVLIQATTVIPDSVLRRRMQMRGIALRSTSSALVSGVIGITAALAGLGVWALVLQQVSLYLVYAVMLWIVHPWVPNGGLKLWALRDIRASSLHTLGGAVGDYVFMQVDALLMGPLLGPAVLGLYRFARRFPEIIGSMTTGGLQQISLPHLVQHLHDRASFAHQLGRIMHGAAVFTLPGLGIVAGTAEPLVMVIGGQWAPAVGALRLLCVVSAFSMIKWLLTPALQAAQRPAIPAAFTWISAALSASGILLAVHLSAGGDASARLMAVAWAALGVQATSTILMGYVAYRRVLGVSVVPTLAAFRSGLFAGLLAMAAGVAVTAFGASHAGRVGGFLLTGTVATVVAGVALFSSDREVRRWVGLFRQRYLRRRPAMATAQD